MVECQLPKLDVAGSNPVSRSNIHLKARRPEALISGAGGRQGV